MTRPTITLDQLQQAVRNLRGLEVTEREEGRMTRPTITLDQLQQAVLSLRRSQRQALHVGSTNGNAVEKIRVNYNALNTVIYFLGTQERIAELHGRDTND